MSELTATQTQFLSLVSSLPSTEMRQAFFRWLEHSFLPESSEWTSSVAAQRKTLHQLSQRLRAQLPPDAVTDDERDVLVARNAVHFDAFLLDDMDVEDMDSAQAVCNVCGSRDTQLLEPISHSSSIDRLEYVFVGLLPNLKGKKVLDVGSRTGNVLYAAHLFSEASDIVGVEINGEFCDLASETVDAFNMGDRVRVLHADIRDAAAEVASADVLVLNNVFEWFNDEDNEKRLWAFLRANVKKGAFLVTVPDLSTVAERLGVDFDDWVTSLEAMRPEQCVRDIVVEEDDKVFLYQVIQSHSS